MLKVITAAAVASLALAVIIAPNAALAENGEIAVQKFQSGQYDLVLMDLQMPILDGYLATEQIRKWEREHQLKPVPIIALSAYALQSEIDKSRDAGCTAYLTKPIFRQKLLDALEKYGAGRSTRANQALSQVSPSQPTLANIDQRLRAMIPAYLAERRRDIGVMSEAAEKGDYEQIRTIGHKMSGSGAGYGFPEITAIGHRLELAAESLDANKIRTHVAEATEYLDVLEREMQKLRCC